jgi:hypothetical protein
MTFRDQARWDVITAMPDETDEDALEKRRYINEYYDDPNNRVIVSSAQNLLALSTPLSFDMRNIFETIYGLRSNLETIEPNERHLLIDYTGRLACLRVAPRFKGLPKAAIMWRGMVTGELEHYTASDVRVLTEDLFYFLWSNLPKDEEKHPPDSRLEPGRLVQLINEV